jgi:wee1-like protein kinase
LRFQELLNGPFDQLTKADIFSLGCTIYEAGSGQALENNGPAWRQLRSGNAPPLERYSANMNEMVLAMLHPNPGARPTIDLVLGHPALVTSELNADGSDTDQLRKQLAAEKARNRLMLQ